MRNLYKRPLVLFAIAHIAGIIIGNYTSSFAFAAAFLILIAAFFYAVYDRLGTKKYISIGILVFYALGAFQFLCVESINNGKFAQYASEYVRVRGYIASEPDLKESKVSYIVKVEEIGFNDDFSGVKGKILLSSALDKNTIALEYGGEVVFDGQLNLPKGVRNPGGFDYRRYLAQKGVSAVVFAMGGDIRKGSGNKSSILADAGRVVRKRIVNVIENSMPVQQSGLLNGILIGYREGLTEEVQKAFSDAGLTHIMAVSGANIAFMMAPLLFLFKKLHIKHNISYSLVIAFLVFFVYITGFEPSVLRAVIMGIVILLGRMLMREPDIYSSLAFSSIVLLVYSPYMLFNIGFQLSFAATLSLVLLNKSVRKLLCLKFIHPKVVDILSATISAQLGVLPITLFYFNKLSIISVLTNLLVVPLIEVITVLGMAMAVLGQISLLLSQILGYLNCLLLSFVLYVTKLASEIPFATIRTVTPSLIAVLAYYFMLGFLVLYYPGRKNSKTLRYAAAFIVLTTLIVFTIELLPGKLEVVFLDVGEGDSAFIRTSCGKTVLIDGGGSTNPTVKSKIGDSVLIPFLLDSGVSSIDLIIATHGHTDHIQGLFPVLQQFKVDNLVIPSLEDEKDFLGLLTEASTRKVKLTHCSRGETINLDAGTKIEVLNPPADYNPGDSNLNNTSIVLKLVYKETGILFTGDAEVEEEAHMIDDKTFLEADILKVAHHGSDTSTCMEFLEQVNPKAAVISVGKNNFGHPSQDVLNRLAEAGVKVFRTDEAGAVIVRSNGRRISISRTVGVGR